MKVILRRLLGLILPLSLTTTLLGTPLGTAFTYQGRLNSGSTPANGSFDLVFALYDATTAGGQVGNSLTNTATPVTNGLFTVTLDFGSSAFDGSARWLQIGVRTNGSGAFTTLAPRQPLTPVPYAIAASNLTGTLPATQLAGALPSANWGGIYSGGVTLNNAANSFTGNGAGLTALNASQLSSGTVPDARLAANVARTNQVWLLNGNTGTTPGTQFLGTTDGQPLEFKVTGLRALRLEVSSTLEQSPNVIGGSPVNFVASGVVGATIAGGGAGNRYGRAMSNRVDAHFGSISGGAENTIQTGAEAAAISGGAENTIQAGAGAATISGGTLNTIQTNANQSLIGGGWRNTIRSNAVGSVIVGGWDNTIQSDARLSTIGGGLMNMIQTNAAYSTLGGGQGNTIQTDAAYSTLGGGQGNTISTNADYSAIGGGYQNAIHTNTDYSTIAGGYRNTIQANADMATIAGGEANTIQRGADEGATIGGGLANIAGGIFSTVPGGTLNSAMGFGSFAAGRRAKANHYGTFVWADWQDADFASTAPNQFLIRAANGVGINKTNPTTALDVNGTVTATGFSGSGAGLTALPAANLSGTIPSGSLADNSVTAAKLASDAGSLSKVAAGAMTSSGGNIGIGTVSPYDALLDVEGDVRLNMHELYLREGSDRNHGLGWYGAGRLFAGVNIDGPVAYGWSGGGLGATSSTNLALRWTGDGNVALDPLGQNTGNLLPGLTFGSGSGEGIASKRSTGGNQYGLDFYTSFQPRMSIAQSGNVGIGTNQPQTALHVNGTVTANALNTRGTVTAGALSVVDVSDLHATNDMSISVTNDLKIKAGTSLDMTTKDVDISASGKITIKASGDLILKGAAISFTDNVKAYGLTLNDHDIDWRHDGYNGAGWYGVGKPFAGTTPDGPVLYGFDGGALGYANSGVGTNIVLRWNSSGRVGIGTTSLGYLLTVGSSGTPAYCNGTAWVNGSDRNAKEDFSAINPLTVLEKVTALPITQWKYKTEEQGTEHIGPMAQDFHAAFGLNGDDDKHIATVDESGVALAAIQGLNSKLEAKSQKLEAENARLSNEVAELKALVQTLAAKVNGGKLSAAEE